MVLSGHSTGISHTSDNSKSCIHIKTNAMQFQSKPNALQFNIKSLIQINTYRLAILVNGKLQWLVIFVCFGDTKDMMVER